MGARKDADPLAIDIVLIGKRADRWRIVDRRDHDGSDCGRKAAQSIADSIGNGGRADKVAIRRKGYRAIGIDDRAAIDRLRRNNLDRRHRITVRIGIVCENRHRNRCIFGSAIGVIYCQWRLVAYRPSKGGRGHPSIAVICRYGHGVNAVSTGPASRRGWRNLADDSTGCWIYCQSSRQSCRREAKRIAFDIAKGLCNRHNDDLAVGIEQIRQAVRARRIIDWSDRNGNSCGIGATITVADRVGDDVGAVEIGPWDVIERPIGVDDYRSVRRRSRCHR